MTRQIALIGTLFVLSLPLFAEDPYCSENWATPMTFAHLKNAGITDNEKLDWSKTVAKRIASEKIGSDLYHQVYLVRFTEKSGKVIEAIAVHDASSVECSMTGVEVFLVAKRLGP